jgi:large subunit ribosomal protein L31
MKAGIHPNYQEATVVCSCGNTFTTRSTRTNLRTDLCNVCHPFYTGEQRIVDTAGQVERFTRRMESAAATNEQRSKRQRRLQARTERIRTAQEEAAAAAQQRDEPEAAEQDDSAEQA